MKTFGKGLFILFTLAVLANALYYAGFTGNEGILSNKPETLKNSWFYLLMFYSHILGGAIALSSGVIQLLFTLSKRKSHRVVGKTYVISVLMSGVAGGYIALYASTGLIAQAGFFFLAVFWIYSTFMAFIHIRNGNRELHRQWIIRSMALTMAAITLRIWIPSFLIAGMEFNTAYPIIAWLCWVPNLVVAEFQFVRKQKLYVIPA